MNFSSENYWHFIIVRHIFVKHLEHLEVSCTCLQNYMIGYAYYISKSGFRSVTRYCHQLLSPVFVHM